MDVVEYFNISYNPAAPSNPFQTFDVYVPQCVRDTLNHQPDTPGLVCFIHGGAWRAEDKADHALLARNLALATGSPVALPNYRLTPRDPTPDNYLHHPAHAEDVLRFLEFVLAWDGGHISRRPERLFLIGHSCSAHMLCTIFMRMPGDSGRVCPSDKLVQATAAIIMSEGIYDIDLLLSSFPKYKSWFIENTFGTRDSFESVSAIKAMMDPKAHHIRWLIIHSKGDTLVDERQSQGMYDFLIGKSCPVSKSFDQLGDEHDDILKSPRYVDIIDSYIKGVVCADAV